MGWALLTLIVCVVCGVRRQPHTASHTSKLTHHHTTTLTPQTDPTRPRLVDLLTEAEHKKFQRMRCNARPVYVMSEMNLLAYRIINLSRDSMVRFWGDVCTWFLY